MLEPFGDLVPRVDPTAWVHHTVTLTGDVLLGPRVSVWPGCVLRGDHGRVFVGEETNIQDLTVCHGTEGLSTTEIGARVTVGHRAVLHGCIVEDDCLVGMGAILLDNCRIGAWSIVGAGAVVPVNMQVPPRSLVLGVPARVVRPVTEKDLEQIRHGHQSYLELQQKAWRG